MKKIIALSVAVALLTACDAAKKDGSAADNTTTPTSAVPAAANATTADAAPSATGMGTDGLRFDPANVAIGQRLGEMMVAEASLAQATAQPGKPYAGRMRFSGALELTGHLVASPDPTHKTPCFEADKASAARTPRMLGDTAPVRICFQNDERAADLTGEMAPPAPATVEIREYNSSYSYTGASNSAMLITLYPGIGH